MDGGRIDLPCRIHEDEGLTTRLTPEPGDHSRRGEAIVTGDALHGSTQLDEVARRANVPIEFVRRLAALGALSDDLSIAVKRELGRVRLLYAWSQAGFAPETIMRLVDQKALSITFLDAPAVQAAGRLDRRYEDLAVERGFPESLLERLHESIGFEPPNSH